MAVPDPAPPAPGPYLQTVSGRFFNPFEPDPAQIDIVWTKFMFQPGPGYITPFSWHLTASQKDEIAESWRDLVHEGHRPHRPRRSSLAAIHNRRQESPLATVDQFFPRQNKHATPADPSQASTAADNRAPQAR